MNCELNHHRYTIETRIGSKWIFKRKPQTTNRREQKNRRTDEQTNSNSNLHLQNFDVSVENVKEWKHERETNRQTKNDKHVVWTFVKVTEMIISGFNGMPGKWNGFSRRRCAHINVIFGKWFFFSSSSSVAAQPSSVATCAATRFTNSSHVAARAVRVCGRAWHTVTSRRISSN